MIYSDITFTYKADKFRKIVEMFESFRQIDVYLLAGMIGVINDVKSQDRQEGTDALNIPRNVLHNPGLKLEFLMSTVYLIKSSHDLEDRDLLRNAFETNDYSDVSFRQLDRVALFHEYALGGIDILYTKIVEQSNESTLEPVDILIDYYEELYNKVESDLSLEEFEI
jgi:hypothetical protein